jgi:AcrR family transcriptional regulator
VARRNDHSRDELRRMSLEAAEDILTREGAHALSVRRIAQSIGYSHGTLYLVFRNLDGLLLELNARTLDDLAAALEHAAGAQPDARARLDALAGAYLRFAREHSARWRLVFEHRLPGGEPVPEVLAQRIARGYRTLHQALADVGAAARDRAELGAALWAAIHGVCVLALDSKLVDAAGAKLDPVPVLARTVAAFCTLIEHAPPPQH